MNIVFSKNRSFFIVVWLIAMQLVAPFMHGHPSGIGAVTGAGIHMHMSDDMDIDAISTSGSKDTQPTMHAAVIHQHIVAVASGIAEKLKLDLNATALLLVIAWAIFNLLHAKHYPPLASPRIKRHPNRTRSPRAPPTLN